MSVRLAVRALILREDRLLLVNAWPSGQSDLLCAPGGGVERGSSLPDNLQREVWEECGLRVEVGAVAMVNEFHDPNGSFHQVEVFFRCSMSLLLMAKMATPRSSYSLPIRARSGATCFTNGQ